MKVDKVASDDNFKDINVLECDIQRDEISKEFLKQSNEGLRELVKIVEMSREQKLDVNYKTFLEGAIDYIF